MKLSRTWSLRETLQIHLEFCVRVWEIREWIVRIRPLTPHPSFACTSLWKCVSVFIRLYLLFVPCACVHVLVCSQRPSSAVWSGVQMVALGPAEGKCLSVLVSFPLPFFAFPLQLFCARFHLPVTPRTTCSLSSLHLLRAILGWGEFSTLFSLSVLLYAPLRAQCGSYTWWLWNEMSLNRAMCPGAAVIAGEIQLPL